MAIPVTALHILRLLSQSEQNLSGLQRDMRANAKAWAADAVVPEADLAALAQNMEAAAAAYLTRLDWMVDLRADAVTWAKVAAMYAAFGGAAEEFDAIEAPMRQAAQSLMDAEKLSAAAIAAACTQVLESVTAPASIWPE